jgi:hypothetical protein
MKAFQLGAIIVIALGAAMLSASAWIHGVATTTSAPLALIIFGDGQSLMQAPLSSTNSVIGTISGGVFTFQSGPYSSGGVGVGSSVGCAGCGQGLTIAAMSGSAGCGSICTGTATGGAGQTYGLSNGSLTANGGASQTVYIIPTSQQSLFAALTTSPQYPYAYMIALASGISSPRAIIDANTVADGASVTSMDWPMNPANLTGFTGLREAAAMSNLAGSAGNFNLETPLSAGVYQFIQEGGIPSSTPVIAANVARGSAGWALAGCAPWGGPIDINCLSPGSNWWSDKINIVSFIKESIQYGMNGSNPLANNSGYYSTQMAGVLWRQGEVAAAGNSATTANPAGFTGASSTITMSSANVTGSLSIHPGDAIWDNATSCFVGYVHDWPTTSTTLTLAAINSDGTPNLSSTGTAHCSGSTGAADTLWFSEAHSYVNELLDVAAEYNTYLDNSDTPFSLGVPIVALQISTASYQQANTWTPLVDFAFVDAALANRNVVLAGPNFVCPFQSDTIHNTSQGNGLCGAYMGQWLAQWRLGTRTPPFAMAHARFLTPTQGDGVHYIIRVTFQMSPFSSALQFYGDGIIGAGSSDTNIPSIPNYGFQYTDGALAGRKSSLFKCGTAGSRSISSVQLATSTASHPGNANEIDLIMSGDASGATNPTVCLGGSNLGNLSWYGSPLNVQLISHNVADRSCRLIADTALRGKAFFNSPCGTGTADYLVNFAANSAVNVGAAALTPAW